MSILHAAAALGLVAIAAPALANVDVGSVDYGFEQVSEHDRIVTFDGPLPSGFTIKGGVVRNYSDSAGAAPATSPTGRDVSNYLTVNPGEYTVLFADTAYRKVSLFWGSMDRYNTLDLLNKSGNIFASYTADQIYKPADGNQSSASTNRRVTFVSQGSTSPIYGLRLSSSSPAFEADNITFAAPVPEPATWASLASGLAFSGLLARRRKRHANRL